MNLGWKRTDDATARQISITDADDLYNTLFSKGIRLSTRWLTRKQSGTETAIAIMNLMGGYHGNSRKARVTRIRIGGWKTYTEK